LKKIAKKEGDDLNSNFTDNYEQKTILAVLGLHSLNSLINTIVNDTLDELQKKKVGDKIVTEPLEVNSTDN
jgi:hypothetical protein